MALAAVHRVDFLCNASEAISDLPGSIGSLNHQDHSGIGNNLTWMISEPRARSGSMTQDTVL